MIRAIFLFICLLSTSACLPVIRGQSVYTDAETHMYIQHSCQQLADLGNVKNLLQSIDQDMERLHLLLDRGNPLLIEGKLTALGADIHSNSDTLNQILDSDFTKIDFEQNIFWVVDKGLVKPYIRNDERVWRFKSANIEKAYSWRGEDTGLLSMVEMSVEENLIWIRFRRPASLVELCQLQKTLILVLNVQLESGQHKQTIKFRLQSRNEGVL